MRVLLVVAVFCAGCALLSGSREDAALRPAALLDAYLVAHGMAASYAESPNANPAVVLQLARLDYQAAAAVRAQSGATAQAVAALTDYAARQSATAAP